MASQRLQEFIFSVFLAHLIFCRSGEGGGHFEKKIEHLLAFLKHLSDFYRMALKLPYFSRRVLLKTGKMPKNEFLPFLTAQ